LPPAPLASGPEISPSGLADNDRRLSRRPTEGRPVGSKRGLGRHSLFQKRPRLPGPLPHQPPAGPPAPPGTKDPSAFHRWMPAGTPVWSPPLPASPRPPADFPPPGASPKRRRPDGPPSPPPAPPPAPLPAPACRWTSLRRERRTSGRPAPQSARPSRNAHCPNRHRPLSHPGPGNRALCPNEPRAPFPQTPGMTGPTLPAGRRRPPGTFLPKQAPRSLPTPGRG